MIHREGRPSLKSALLSGVFGEAGPSPARRGQVIRPGTWPVWAAGAVVSAGAMSAPALGSTGMEPRRATPIDNVIDVQVARLRRKVDVDGHELLIHTVRGVGFVLREGEP